MTCPELKRDFLARTDAIRPPWWGRAFRGEFGESLRGKVFAAVVMGWPEDSSQATAARNAKLILRREYKIDPITLLLIGAIIQIAVNVILEWLKQRWDERHSQLRGWQRMLLGTP